MEKEKKEELKGFLIFLILFFTISFIWFLFGKQLYFFGLNYIYIKIKEKENIIMGCGCKKNKTVKTAATKNNTIKPSNPIRNGGSATGIKRIEKRIIR